ncbi:MAG: cytochrome c3 family protein, partial [Coriobacteriia bacterium]
MAALAGALVAGVFVLPAMGNVTPNLYPNVSTPSSNSGWTCTNWSTYLDDSETANIAVSTGQGQVFLIDIDDPSAASGAIESVTVYTSAMSTASSQRDGIQLAVNGTTTGYLFGGTTGVAKTTYTEYNSGALTVNPSTTSAWTWSDITDLKIGVIHTATGAADTVNVTQLYAVVTFTPDTAAPTVTINAPADIATVSASPYTVSGTAADTGGSGLDPVPATVQIRIGRDTDGNAILDQYWSPGASTWVTTDTWFSSDAFDGSAWSYSWTLPAEDNAYTYQVDARATDLALNTGSADPATGVKVDTIGPSLVSATAVSTTAVDLLFDEDLDGETVLPVRFAINNGMIISAASLDLDKRTVHLTLSTTLAGSTIYTVSLPGVVTDLAGNPDRNNTATFDLQSVLTVAAGADYPSSLIYSTRGDLEAVDHITFTASNADATIDSIKVRGLDTVDTLTTDVQSVSLLADDGDGVWEPLIDTAPLGTSAIFSGVAGDGSQTATFSGLARTVAVGAPLRVWVVYTVSNAAIYDHIVGSEIRTGDVTVSSGSVSVTGSPIKSSGATAGQTIYVDGPPSVNITDPAADGAFFTGASKLIQGTASDGGSGLSAVTVMIQRSDGKYWDDATDAWVVGSIWNPATGTTNWTLVWALDPAQDHSYTYAITARATDVSGSSTTAARTGITVDNVAPSIASITPPPNGNELTVVFSEELLPGSVEADGSDFAITDSSLNPLAVTGAALQADGKTIVLATAAQAPGESYTVTVAAGNVTDLYANTNALATGLFSGFGVVDSEPPSVSITAPGTNANLNTSPYGITGTASDTGGSGLASVAVRITRSDGKYWSGAAWTDLSIWLDAGGPAAWLYPWTATSNDRALTHIIEARATDGSNNQTVVSVTGVRLDSIGPTIVSASPVDATHVDVTLSEAVDPLTVGLGDFSIAVIGVTEVIPQGPGYTHVILTTGAQIPDTNYTVQTAAGSFTDATPYSVPNQTSSASFAAFGSGMDIAKPLPPSAVNVAAGADPVIAVVSWSGASDNVGVVSYRIYRATSASGTYSAIGVSAHGTEPITFEDKSGVPGQAYYYKVSALDAAGNESALSSAVGPVSATWTRAPHAAYTSATTYCRMCHVPHSAASEQSILRDVGEQPADTGVCYACHDGSGASTNIKTGPVNSFAQSSGHYLEATATDPDLTNSCAGCHDPHRDYTTATMLPGTTVNGVTLTAGPNAWCLACHNVTNAWYGTGYPNSSAPTVDTTGYPTVGTFPTISGTYIAYTDATYNAHVSMPASPTADPVRAQGDCLYCHASHRGTSAYDGLVARFQPSTAASLADDQANGTYAALCFKCHGSNDFGFTTAAPNIKQFVTTGGERSGHRIETAGGTYPVGTPLPCYECHNPHGSTRSNKRLLSDVLGGSLETTTIASPTAADASNVREFCFTCHTTAGSVSGGDGLAYGWDSGTSTYTVAIAAGKKIAGLPRDAVVGANVLRLPAVDGHYRDNTQSCYSCHGSSYAAGGSNVHNPTGGESAGGTDCLSCHAYQSMQSSTGFHHYMTSDSAAAYPSIADPTTLTTTDARRTCLTCHVDHDYFIPANGDVAHTEGRAQNFRSSVAVAPSMSNGSTYVNYDYSDADLGDGGVCTSCHKVQMTKNTTGRNTSADRSAVTVPVSDAIYDISAHNYMATAPNYYTYSEAATFTSDSDSTDGFAVNCGKCHNDTLAKQFQDGTWQFGLHDSDIAALQTDNGQTAVTADPQEQLCWLCHSRSDESQPNNPKGGTLYSGDAPDMYGGGNMSALMNSDSLNTKGMFSNTAIVSKHPVTGDGSMTARVECANCHNPHKTEYDLGFMGASGVVQDPNNTLVGSGVDGDHVWYSGPSTSAELQTNAAFCLKCHDGTTPTYVNDGTSYVPYDVFIPAAEATSMNKSTNSARGHWAVSGAISAGEEVPCATCHDKHGSTLPKLLGNAIDPTGAPTIAGGVVTDNDNTVCYACHTAASTSYPAASRDATNGYPVAGTWPGAYTYRDLGYVADTSGNGHQNAVVVTGKNTLPDMSYAAGDCKVCHDVHGTANTYDETRLAFTPTDFALCFDCHDVDGPASSNIKTYYPGVGTGSGHQIKSATSTLPQGSGLPCYDCHNPHGNQYSAYGLLVVTETAPGVQAVIGDAANEIKMSAADKATAANVRNFCFACHTTGDTVKGWDGDSLEVVTAGAEVEGIDRTVYNEVSGLVLRLPNNVAQHREGGSQSCYTCHGNDYTLSGQNVHNPSGGISTGGQDCYICHSAYQSPMEDDVADSSVTFKIGSTNHDSYHHVLGSATNDGDKAFTGVSNYPTSTTDVYCLSCHVDHNLFNNPGHDLAANLRPNLGAAPTAGVAYEWDGTAGTGICTSCHATSLAKSAVAEKKQDGRTSTPVISDSAYDASAHQYGVTSAFVSDTSPTFSAECSKCHNDELTKEFQSAGNTFGTHWSANQHILAALGGANTGALQESHCYQCHSQADDYGVGELGGAAKVNGKDDYGVANMTVTPGSETVYKQFQLTSKHPVVAAGTEPNVDSVVCENCHNVHAVSASSKVSNPDDTMSPYTYTDVTNQPGFCLKCHDGA